jgi:hypothetical protein
MDEMEDIELEDMASAPRCHKIGFSAAGQRQGLALEVISDS